MSQRHSAFLSCLSSSAWSLVAVGAATVCLLTANPASAQSACFDTATRTAARPRALALGAAAVQEHLAFGSQTLDAEGRLTQAGSSEAEDQHSPARSPAPWQRVLGYWRAIDSDEVRWPYLVRFGALRPADRSLLRQALNQASAAHLQGLGVGPDQGLDSSELRAMEVAIDRVAVIDTPWSAAFISWLAREAGLAADEFVFSEAHADYAGAAWQAGVDEAAGRPTRYAMRACDITQTPPRIGDLVCQARGADAGLDTFDRIGAMLALRPTGGAGLPMHCDAVVAVDGAGFDTVGGNVLQSVTRRRLVFAPGTRVMDPSYRAEGCAPSTDAAAAAVVGCVDRHMSRQPWSLLLQWR